MNLVYGYLFISSICATFFIIIIIEINLLYITLTYILYKTFPRKECIIPLPNLTAFSTVSTLTVLIENLKGLFMSRSGLSFVINFVGLI